MNNRRNSLSRNRNSISDNDSIHSYAVISENLEVNDGCDSNHNASRNRSVPTLLRTKTLQKPSNMFPFSSSSSSASSRSRSAHCDWVHHDPSSSNSRTSLGLPPSQFNKNDLIVSSLKSTFADVLVPFSGNDIDLVSRIQQLFDTQEHRIDFLENQLREKQLQLNKLRARRAKVEVDHEGLIPTLLETYPLAMDAYRKKIKHDEYKKEWMKCTENFDAQKREIINKHKQNYENLKLNYNMLKSNVKKERSTKE